MDQDYISRLQGAIDGLQNIITERLNSMSQAGVQENNPEYYKSLHDDVIRLRGKIEGVKLAREYYTGH
jgi:hypothetical protein